MMVLSADLHVALDYCIKTFWISPFSQVSLDKLYVSIWTSFVLHSYPGVIRVCRNHYNGNRE